MCGRVAIRSFHGVGAFGVMAGIGALVLFVGSACNGPVF